MSAIRALSLQAQLAEAAYFDFSILGVSTKDALIAGKFSPAQADAFIAQWQVIDQYTGPTSLGGLVGSGFSATLFRDTTTGIYSFALRGTEFGIADLLNADFHDLVIDGIAMDRTKGVRDI